MYILPLSGPTTFTSTYFVVSSLSGHKSSHQKGENYIIVPNLGKSDFLLLLIMYYFSGEYAGPDSWSANGEHECQRYHERGLWTGRHIPNPGAYSGAAPPLSD